MYKIFRVSVAIFALAAMRQLSAQVPQGDMVLVEGGTFTMGCTAEQAKCRGHEKPAHAVNLKSFYINKFEVTQAQYQAIMGKNPSKFTNCTECPVEQVSWDDAQEFIKKLNAKTGQKYRLPTEAEWEYAARGGKLSTGTQYSGSSDMDKAGWYRDNSASQTHIHGLKLPNELGLYDMSGNVWEWCSDWYSDVYYDISPSDNPTGPERGEKKVQRGGAWDYIAAYGRVANRDSGPSYERANHIGFRLAKD